MFLDIYNYLFLELPTGISCEVNYDSIDPNTCNVGNRITWTSSSNKLNAESLNYTLYSNNSVFYSVFSPQTSFDISNDTSVRPREEVNFTLTAANFVGQSSFQCFVDIIPCKLSLSILSELPWVWEYPWGFPFPWDGNGNEIFFSPVGIPIGILWGSPWEYLFESCGNPVGIPTGFIWKWVWNGN